MAQIKTKKFKFKSNFGSNYSNCLICSSYESIKFGYSEKATTFEKNIPLRIWFYSVTSNFKWNIFFQILWPSQNIRTLFRIFVHCEMQQSWAKKTLKNFHRIYSIHFYIQQQLSVIFFYHDNLTKSIYYSLVAHFRSTHVIIPHKVSLKVLWRALLTKYNLIFGLVWTGWTDWTV